MSWCDCSYLMWFDQISEEHCERASQLLAIRQQKTACFFKIRLHFIILFSPLFKINVLNISRTCEHIVVK